MRLHRNQLISSAKFVSSGKRCGSGSNVGRQIASGERRLQDSGREGRLSDNSDATGGLRDAEKQNLVRAITTCFAENCRTTPVSNMNSS